MMSFETEFTNMLISLAECRIDSTTWKDWWTVNAPQVKIIIGSGDFSRLNCVPSMFGISTFMLKCQKGAEHYLLKKKIPFYHSELYAKGADEEHKSYVEKLEQKRMAEQAGKQKQYEQRKHEIEELFDKKDTFHNGLQSGLRTLPLTAKNVEFLKLIIEWNEFLAKENYDEALGMFQHYNHQLAWTPELLESSVYGYGCPGYTRSEAEKAFGSSDYKVTSLLDNPSRNEILHKIEIDHYTLLEEQAKLRCLTDTDYENIIGDIHYDGVPLNGEESDLTAIFLIKKVDSKTITLCFYDLHVM